MAEIDELLDDDQFAFAEPTLSGIRSWVEENEHCTEAQQTAVSNIAESKG